MNLPKSVNQAVIAIWTTLLISAITAAINKQIGVINSSEFALYLVLYGILCILPYKISRRSNPTRHVYAVISVISFMLMLGGQGKDISKLDLVVSYLMTPVEIFILYRLFSGEANGWFSQDK